MIGIKVYPEFSLQLRGSDKDREFLNTLLAVKNSTEAQYVNFAVFDYAGSTREMKHFLTYPMDWITHYVKHSFHEFDPLLTTVDYRRVSFVDWRELWRSDDEIRFYKASREHGIGANGLSLISHLGHHLYGALSITYDTGINDWDGYRDGNMELLRFQSERVGEQYLSLFTRAEQDRYHLTKRELECLYWVALGKTDGQIAQLMGIGRWTVVGHIKSAKYKLDCSNRTAAVATAVTCGLLDLRAAV